MRLGSVAYIVVPLYSDSGRSRRATTECWLKYSPGNWAPEKQEGIMKPKVDLGRVRNSYLYKFIVNDESINHPLKADNEIRQDHRERQTFGVSRPDHVQNLRHGRGKEQHSYGAANISWGEELQFGINWIRFEGWFHYEPSTLATSFWSGSCRE